MDHILFEYIALPKFWLVSVLSSPVYVDDFLSKVLLNNLSYPSCIGYPLQVTQILPAIEDIISNAC